MACINVHAGVCSVYMDYSDAQFDAALLIALGRQLAAERTAAGLSQRDLAKRAGVSPEAIYRYENGKRDIPMKVLNAIAVALGLRPSQILLAAEERAGRDARSASAGQVGGGETDNH